MELIASLTPAASRDPLSALHNPPGSASLVELRADLFPGVDPHAAVRCCPLPVLFTLRSTHEGGHGPDDPVQRRAALASAREAGATLLDLEAERDSRLLDELGLEPERVVLSWHDPQATPRDLAETAASMLATPARWLKVVPTARSLADLEQVLTLHGRFNRPKAGRRRLITFAMGVPGIPSRYLAPLLGPPLAYVAWTEATPAAPGQLSAEQLEAVAGHLDGAPQRLYGVVGADVSHSLSPAMHTAAFRALDLPYLFLPVSVTDRSELVELFAPGGEGLFDRLGLPAAGWAVTSPYKQDAADAATRRAPRVERAHAANTLILRRGQVIAENTDADGVVGALRTFELTVQRRLAVVQGTGGAARGAAVGLDIAGAIVVLRGRQPARTRQVAAELEVEWCPPGELPTGCEILVNATPLGTGTDDPSPFSGAEIASATAVVDMVYSERSTALARLATDAGTALIDGREVLAHQGYAQFAAFTGELPPREVMRAALRQWV